MNADAHILDLPYISNSSDLDDDVSRSIYQPLREGQVRVLCLQPDEPGEPLRAKLEIVNLEDARKAQPDLRSVDPEHVDFDESEPNLQRWRALLTQYVEIHRSINLSFETADQLRDQLHDQVQQRNNLRRQLQTAFKGDVAESHAKQNEHPGRLGSNDDRIARAELAKLSMDAHNIYVEDILQFSRYLDTDTYIGLLRIASLLPMVSQYKRDSLVRSATSQGAYEALSYSWGGLDKDRRLSLVNSEHLIPITHAVYDALQQLRLPDQVRRLWIDALCINQADFAERSRQVSIMSRIYGAAARVIVWLGDSDKNTCLAFAVLNAQLSSAMFELTQVGPDGPFSNFHIFTALNLRDTCLFCGQSLGPSQTRTKDGMTALDLLPTRQWFSRLWVVQEVVSASYVEVTSGSHRVPWDAIYSTYRIMCELRDAVWDMRVAMKVLGETYSPCVLLWFLVKTSDRQCSLAHDRIYAIQSITGFVVPETDGICEEMSDRELFIRVSEHCLTLQCMEPLRTADHKSFVIPHVSLLLALAPLATSDPALPSWVPNLDSLPRNGMEMLGEYSYELSDEFRFGQGSFSSFSGTPLLGLNLMQCHTTNCRRSLSMKGCHFAEVAELLEGSEGHAREEIRSESPGDNAAERAMVQAWYQLCKKFVKAHLGHSDCDVRLKEILHCLHPRSGADFYLLQLLGNKYTQCEDEGIPLPSTRTEIFDFIKEAIENESGDVDSQKLFLWTVADSQHDRNRYRARERRRGRKLAALRSTIGSPNTFLGWIPPTFEVGDCVCLFVGAPRPFLLRPFAGGNGGQSFRLLGDCWVHEMCEDDIAEFCEENKQSLGWITLE